MRPQVDHGEKSYRGSGRLAGLAAIITGGDSGIGRAVAIAFAREGADVAIGYLARKEAEDASETVRWIEKAGRRAIKEGQCIDAELDPADLARMALFLAADDSRMITAQDIVVDGGWA